MFLECVIGIDVLTLEFSPWVPDGGRKPSRTTRMRPNQHVGIVPPGGRRAAWGGDAAVVIPSTAPAAHLSGSKDGWLSEDGDCLYKLNPVLASIGERSAVVAARASQCSPWHLVSRY